MCFLFFVLFFVSPCLVLSVASWGSVSLAVSSSSWERRFLYSYERYFVCLTSLQLGNLCLKIKAWVPCCHSPCQPCVPDSVKLGVIFRSLLLGLHKQSYLHVRNLTLFCLQAWCSVMLTTLQVNVVWMFHLWGCHPFPMACSISAKAICAMENCRDVWICCLFLVYSNTWGSINISLWCAWKILILDFEFFYLLVKWREHW